MKKVIKLFDPVIGGEEELAVTNTIRSRFLVSWVGTGNVQKFEDGFKQYLGTKACVAVNNGTATLHLALSLIDIKNKEVIIPSLSLVSTAHTVIYNDRKPVFVDVDPNTLCVDPNLTDDDVSRITDSINKFQN